MQPDQHILNHFKQSVIIQPYISLKKKKKKEHIVRRAYSKKTSRNLWSKNIPASGHEMFILIWGRGYEYFALEYI